jgi:hypothetical protein
MNTGTFARHATVTEPSRAFLDQLAVTFFFAQ